MELASPTITKRGNSYDVRHGDDRELIVEFVKEAVRNNFKSEQAGHEVYEDRDFVWIRFAGDRTRELKKPVTEEHRQRWPVQWARYQAQEAQVNEGLPLEEWAAISKSTALNLKGQNVFTVEQLSAIGDHVIDKLGMGARELRKKAQAFLSRATDGAETMRLIEENRKLREDMEVLKQQMAELGSKKEAKAK